jgi:hypothetical protein
MRVAGSLVVHLIWTLIRLLRPGGTRSIVAESLLIKHQLLILNRSRQRAPALRPSDRVIVGLLAALIRPARQSARQSCSSRRRQFLYSNREVRAAQLNGNVIAAGFSGCRSQLNQEFAPHRSDSGSASLLLIYGELMSERGDFKLKRSTGPAGPSQKRNKEHEPSSHPRILLITRKPSRKSIRMGFRDPQSS